MDCERAAEAGECEAYVALGSNLGERETHLVGAIAALRRTPGIRVVVVSPVYETEPVGPPQGRYLNAVVHLRTSLSPRALLERLLSIEAEAGRVRRPEPNSPRTLDLDLLLYGALSLREPDLEIPHPRLHERAFVLEPLRDLAPDLVHPVLGETIGELARRVRDPGAVRRFAV
jgi:2-amino-4-hydroxy-6-hydroxymethyldihydropteridine diphosphokinase